MPLSFRRYVNTSYIYKGDNLESIMAFTDRMRRKFPEAAMVGPGKETEEMKENPGQHLQISSVTATWDKEMDDGTEREFDPLMPKNLLEHLEKDDVRTFWLPRPFNKRKKMGLPKSKNPDGSPNEFLDLWLRKMYMRSGDRLPAARRRSPIVETSEIILNPVENAVTNVVTKNKELEDAIAHHRTVANRGGDQAFTMAIKGVVMAVVNGGLKMYDAFITGTYKETHPEIFEDVDSTAVKRLAPAKLEVVSLRVHQSGDCVGMNRAAYYGASMYAYNRWLSSHVALSDTLPSVSVVSHDSSVFSLTFYFCFLPNAPPPPSSPPSHVVCRVVGIGTESALRNHDERSRGAWASVPGGDAATAPAVRRANGSLAGGGSKTRCAFQEIKAMNGWRIKRLAVGGCG